MKKNVRSKVCAVFLAAVLSLGSAIPSGMLGLSILGGPGNNSSEVYGAEGHWSEPYMGKLVRNGVMRGDKGGNLNPELGITRAEFIAMINRSFGYKQKGASKFADVPQTAWFHDDISIAAKQGYFSGAEGNLAKPNDILKREEGVTLLCRALKIDGKDEDNFNFIDSQDFSYWSKEYIHAATEKAYINGYPDQTFRPTQEMKRGEMARVLADASGDIVQTQGDATVGYTQGNVTLNTSGTVLKETVVPGDLYITAGLDLGHTTLENVTVLGDLIVSGAGESNSGNNSVVLKDCKIRNMILNSSNGKKLTVRAEGSTEIEKTIVKSNTYLEEGNVRSSAFKDIELNGDGKTHLQLAGIFETVQIVGEKNELTLIKGYISRLIVDEASAGSTITLEKGTEVEDMFLDAGTSVKGTGVIKNVVIGVNGSNIAMLPENIEIRPGVSAIINGKPMTSADAELNALKPQITSGPLYTNIMPTALDATIRANKPGKVYWIVKKKGESAPSLAKMKAPKKDDGVKYGNISVVQEKDAVIKISGLVAGTEYDLYTVLVDLREKNSTIGKSGFSTVDNIAPKFFPGSPTVIPYATSASITYTATKDATMYWAITGATSPAPTATELVNAGSYLAGKVVRGETTIGKETENTVSTGKHGYTKVELDEAKSYNAYMVLKDYSNNLSAVTKITFNSKDVTSPNFMPNYPSFTSTANTSLTMKYMANEDSTVYFAAFVQGDPFPFPASKPSEDMLTTKASIQAVIGGNIGKKSGKATAVADKEGTLQISGLEPKKMYDVYVVLEDKAKNTSNVYLFKDNALMDRTLPTATVTFLPDYDGRPSITSKIIMTFDKVVFDTATGEKLSKIAPAELKKNILLYDREPVDPVGKEVPIRFDSNNTKIEDKNSQTVITFNLTATDLSFDLVSGNKYQFEIRYLADASGNLISPSEVVRLPEFTTIPPQMNLNTNSGSDVDFDLAIELDPQESKVASAKAYDTLIKSNVNATFDIYRVDDADQITSPASVEKQNVMVEKGKVYSLTRLINGGSTNSSNFEAFKDFKEKRIYGIALTMLEGKTNKLGWEGMASFEVQGLIGAGESLYKIAAAPKIYTPTDPYLLKENVQVVTNPISKVYEKPFMDSVVPEFVPPTPTVSAIGDSVVMINLMAKSQAKVYWVLAEKGKINEVPNSSQIVLGQPMTSGGQVGMTEITAPNVLTEVTIDNLTPSTEYELFITPKGNPADSTVYTVQFKTKAVSQPVVSLSLAESGNEKVDARVTVDANATVYWVAYAAEDKRVTPSAVELIERSNITNDKAVSYGEEKVLAGQAKTFAIKNLTDVKKYNVYATAVNPFNAMPADVVSLKNISSKDMVGPSVKTATTTIKGSTVGDYPTFWGEAAVVFNENLYYINEEQETKPLTGSILKTDMQDTTFQITKTGGVSTDGAISSLSISFNKMGINGTKEFSFDVCDKESNNVGKLVFTLRETENPKLPSWDIYFTNLPRN